ncbi:HpcH/HpaI aldolase/citrate lyase family protein [Thalassovita taeanensis]|uniref:Citrate lyase subunit beta / citryl-CoA lyase n=1 Tax=Thalassovita taeanensis TaxID=657014 RepID=A0A1H9BX99_9RHOB|nr:CoA ester lyase [Thalassovita taeanensis]SEP93560.1 citrate lyase subunit beta / citryl-CoA lyase [Thalassovita taeanensis]
MNLRSWQFIPGDSEKKMGKADGSPADALILDIEDSVAPARKGAARGMIRDHLAARPKAARPSQLWVRINPLDDCALEDLSAIMPGAPDGIMIPKTNGPEDVYQLGCYLDALETRDGLELGSTKILPVATETAVAPLRIAEFAQADLPRLIGLTWGAEDLSAAVGASTNLDETGQWALTYRFARVQMLLAAKACGVQAIDTLFVDFRDDAGLHASCVAAANEGFTGRIAIHPAQVETINAAFAPSPQAVAHAQRVIAAFAAAGDAGTVGLDGKMIDIPHLKQAQHVLALHQSYQSRGA